MKILRVYLYKGIMKLNKNIIEEFKNTDSKLLLVTKYLDENETNEIITQIDDSDLEVIE
jgi:hypothetical protein